MKNYLLAFFFASLSGIGFAQNLANTEWLGTNPPSPNIWFRFSADTIYYTFTGSGYVPLSTYTESNGVIRIVDLPGTSLCNDTGVYNYSIVNPYLYYSLISDNCSSRRNTLLNYTWYQLSTGIAGESVKPGVHLLPGENETLIISIAAPLEEFVQITLYDLQGRECRRSKSSQNSIVLSMSGLPPGMYVCRIVNSAMDMSFRVIR